MPVQQYTTHIIRGWYAISGIEDGTILGELKVPEILVRFNLDQFTIICCGEILVIVEWGFGDLNLMPFFCG